MYKVFMGKYGRERLSGMKVSNRMTNTWKESLDVLMEKFFPASNAMRHVESNTYVEVRQFE